MITILQANKSCRPNSKCKSGLWKRTGSWSRSIAWARSWSSHWITSFSSSGACYGSWSKSRHWKTSEKISDRNK